MAEVNYDDDSIRSLDWKEHIRLRPGMYIGKLGDGSAYDDGVYVLLIEGILALVAGIVHLVHLRTVKMQARQAQILKTASVDEVVGASVEAVTAGQ